MHANDQQLELDMEQQTGSKLGEEYVKGIYCHPAYLLIFRKYVVHCAYLLSHVQFFTTPWTAAHQAPLSVGIPKQEQRSGLPFLSPGDLPNPGTEHRFPALQADSLPSEPRVHYAK